MNRAQKNVLLAYCGALILTCVVVPWKITILDGRIERSVGYSFVFNQPHSRRARIDYGRVLLEIVLSTATAGALYLVLGSKSVIPSLASATTAIASHSPESSVQRTATIESAIQLEHTATAGKTRSGWLRFWLSYFGCTIGFGLFRDLTVQRPSWSYYNATMEKILVATFAYYTLIFLLPFVVGLIMSMIVPNRKLDGEINPLPHRLSRALMMAIPVAAVLVWLHWYGMRAVS